MKTTIRDNERHQMIHHKHLLLNARITKPIMSEDAAIDFLASLVSSIDMKIIKGPFAHYVDAPGNRGMTATVMIETSHIAFHIWDEKDPPELKFDLYTCGELDVDHAMTIIGAQFDLIDYDLRVFDRADGFELLRLEMPEQ